MAGLQGPQIKYGKWENENIVIGTRCHGICLGSSGTGDLIANSRSSWYKLMRGRV